MSEVLQSCARWSVPLLLLMVPGFALNLPFGWLRAGTPRLSVPWFLYIHLPIPALLLLRQMLSLGHVAIPFSMAAGILGQICGHRVRRRFCHDPDSHLTTGSVAPHPERN